MKEVKESVPKCQRMCGRDCAWDSEPGGDGDGSWFSWCSPCLMASALLVKGFTCIHHGHTAGQLAPAYPSDGAGRQLGWLCTGFGADLCGRVFDKTGVELVYPRSYEVHADVGEGREAWEAGHPLLETAEIQARKWLHINAWRRHEVTIWVVEVFADGPMKGQIAWTRAL